MKINNDDPDKAISRIATAISEPARVRILYSLLDGHARTSTELSAVAEVSASTTSSHLNRLKSERLVKVMTQGKHRYYSLSSVDVATALEALSLVAGSSRSKFVPSTPTHLLEARTCYDHLAGKLGVGLHDRFKELGWLIDCSPKRCEVSPDGVKAFEKLGIDLAETSASRRRFAYECLDWSERQPHLAGALGAALLRIILKKRWVTQHLDSRALSITAIGSRELEKGFGLRFATSVD